MNKKFKKAIQDTFVSPEAMHRDEFFKNAENLIEAGNKRRRKSIPLIYRLSAAAVFTAAAIGIGIGLNTVKPPKISDFRESEIVTETTAVNNPTTENLLLDSKKILESCNDDYKKRLVTDNVVC